VKNRGTSFVRFDAIVTILESYGPTDRQTSLLWLYQRLHSLLACCATALVKFCQSAFNLVLPSIQIAKRREKFVENEHRPNTMICRLLGRPEW